MDANFFGAAPDPAADPRGFQNQQAMAAALMQRGVQGQRGTMAGGQYVAPSPLSYINQLGSGALGGLKTGQLAEATRASDILNGGTGQTAIGKFGGWLGGLLGGGS